MGDAMVQRNKDDDSRDRKFSCQRQMFLERTGCQQKQDYYEFFVDNYCVFDLTTTIALAKWP